MIRVLVADDHPIFRQGLRQVLGDTPDLAVAGEAADGETLLSEVREGRFDAVVLDLAMPGPGGLEVLRRIKESRPDLPVVVLSMHAEDQYAERVLRAGASGYLTKGGEPSETCAAIRKAVSGGIYVSGALAEKLATDLLTPADGPPHTRLSDREHQVMLGIAAGTSPTRMADQLGLSVKTISTYRARVLEKLGLATSVDVVRYAIREDLIS